MVWRLENGETPAVGQAEKVVLLIGSNDLDYYWDEVSLCNVGKVNKSPGY